MIQDEELIEMIRISATEQLPIAVMTIKEMRRFAEQIAMDCVRIAKTPAIPKEDIIRVIKDRYATPKH